MRKLLTQNQLEVLEHQLSCWPKQKRISPEDLRKLQPHNQILLKELVDSHALGLSDGQLRDLVKDLNIIVGARELDLVSVENATRDQLLAFFYPDLGAQLEMIFDDR